MHLYLRVKSKFDLMKITTLKFYLIKFQRGNFQIRGAVPGSEEKRRAEAV